jgi:hypothetical protein
MANAAKPGLEPLSAPPNGTSAVAFDRAEASENVSPSPGQDVPPPLPRPAHDLRQPLADPLANGSAPARRTNLRTAFPEEDQDSAGAPPSLAPRSFSPEENPALRAPRLSGRLAALAETAKTYARAAQADNTQRAYAADWRHFASWLRRQGLPETPPDPEAVGLYLASQVERRGAELAVATLERRLSGIAWRYRQLGHRSTSATGISRPCSPVSADATLALPCRRPPSSSTSFWRCWRRWTWI